MFTLSVLVLTAILFNSLHSISTQTVIDPNETSMTSQQNVIPSGVPPLDLVTIQKPEPGLLGDALDLLKSLGAQLDCSIKLAAHALECMKQVERDWSDRGDKSNCCGYYDWMYCIRDYAKNVCEPSPADKVDTAIKEKCDQKMDGVCSDYGHRWHDWKSWKCHFPWLWFFVIIGVIGVVVLLVCALRTSKKN